MDKNLIKKRFQSKLKTYDDNAIAQKIVVENLTKLVPYKNYQNVLEIGCGTGFLSKKLDYLNAQKLYLNDLFEDVRDYSKIKNLAHEFLIGDIEKIDFPENLDLIISANSLQWILNLELLFEKINKALNPNGSFIFSLFTVGNCAELANIFDVSLNYKNEAEIINMLNPNFIVNLHKTENITLYFSNTKAILNHIKLTGANSVKTVSMTKSQLKKAEQEYEELRTEKGLPLTYVTSYFRATKN